MAGFTVTTTRYGYLAPYVASFHGTPGQALADGASKVGEMLDSLATSSPEKPYYLMKIYGEANQSASGVAEQIAQVQARGGQVILQVRDDEPDGRTFNDAVAAVETLVAAMTAEGVDCSTLILCYGNEYGLNNPNLSLSEFIALMTSVYDHFLDLGTFYGFSCGGVGGWAELPAFVDEYLAQASPELVAVTRVVDSHHYNGRPTLVREHQIKELMAEKLPNAVLLMTEGDLTFTGRPNEADLHNAKGSVFMIHANLANAMYGIRNMDFTFQNHENLSPAQTGNGIYRSDGSPNTQGTTFEEVITPFAKKKALVVERDGVWDSTDVFANANELIIVNNPIDPLDDMPKWLRISAKGEDTTHLDSLEIYRWLIGLTTRPSYPGKWEPDWAALKAAWDIVADDAAEGSKTVTVNLPVRVRKWEVVYTIADGTAPTYAMNGRTLVAEMPSNTALYLRAVDYSGVVAANEVYSS